MPWTGIEPGLPSLPILRSEPRSRNDRVRDQGGFCNIVGGVMTPVWVPHPDDEAIRDLTRAREDAKRLEHKARMNLTAFLLRHQRRYALGRRLDVRYLRGKPSSPRKGFGCETTPHSRSSVPSSDTKEASSADIRVRASTRQRAHAVTWAMSREREIPLVRPRTCRTMSFGAGQ